MPLSAAGLRCKRARSWVDRAGKFPESDLAIEKVLQNPVVKQNADRLLRDQFLYDRCWKKWDSEGIVDRTTRESSCSQFPENEPYLVRLFRRLYVSRKQILHGCSTDGGSKNRPSLMAAVPVLGKLVPVFIDLVDAC